MKPEWDIYKGNIHHRHTRLEVHHYHHIGCMDGYHLCRWCKKLAPKEILIEAFLLGIDLPQENTWSGIAGEVLRDAIKRQLNEN